LKYLKHRGKLPSPFLLGQAVGFDLGGTRRQSLAEAVGHQAKAHRTSGSFKIFRDKTRQGLSVLEPANDVHLPQAGLLSKAKEGLNLSIDPVFLLHHGCTFSKLKTNVRNREDQIKNGFRE
jgi:hypothetical protein